MQLVMHSPYGSRLNRAWGLALRKRFCSKFNFELQAAATEDNIVISLTEAHSFELDDVPRYLHSASVRDVLIQAVLDSPMFTTRWRWVSRRVARPAALPRRPQGAAAARAHGCRGPDRRGLPRPDRLRREPPRRARDPRPSAGPPDHRRLPRRGDGYRRPGAAAQAHRIGRHPRGRRAISPQPSPLALEVLSARPYAYLDDAPLEERRTQAVMARRWLAPEDATGARPARPRGDRAGARGEPGPTPPIATSCTTAWSGSAS